MNRRKFSTTALAGGAGLWSALAGRTVSAQVVAPDTLPLATWQPRRRPARREAGPPDLGRLRPRSAELLRQRRRLLRRDSRRLATPAIRARLEVRVDVREPGLRAAAALPAVASRVPARFSKRLLLARSRVRARRGAVVHSPERILPDSAGRERRRVQARRGRTGGAGLTGGLREETPMPLMES
jgi:hypothetical protein